MTVLILCRIKTKAADKCFTALRGLIKRQVVFNPEIIPKYK